MWTQNDNFGSYHPVRAGCKWLEGGFVENGFLNFVTGEYENSYFYFVMCVVVCFRKEDLCTLLRIQDTSIVS